MKRSDVVDDDRVEASGGRQGRSRRQGEVDRPGSIACPRPPPGCPRCAEVVKASAAAAARSELTDQPEPSMATAIAGPTGRGVPDHVTIMSWLATTGSSRRGEDRPGGSWRGRGCAIVDRPWWTTPGPFVGQADGGGESARIGRDRRCDERPTAASRRDRLSPGRDRPRATRRWSPGTADRSPCEVRRRKSPPGDEVLDGACSRTHRDGV